MLAWLIDNVLAHIPVWIWTTMATIGVIVYIISGIVERIGIFKLDAELVRLISILVFTTGIFMWGGAGITAIFQKEVAAKQAEIDAAVQKSKETNVVIEQQIVYRDKIIHDKQVVVQHDIARDAAVIDSECKVAPQAIKDLNEAAQ